MNGINYNLMIKTKRDCLNHAASIVSISPCPKEHERDIMQTAKRLASWCFDFGDVLPDSKNTNRVRRKKK
jgi:hypothetical protein